MMHLRCEDVYVAKIACGFVRPTSGTCSALEIANKRNLVLSSTLQTVV